jgi:hypothetical protein
LFSPEELASVWETLGEGSPATRFLIGALLRSNAEAQERIYTLEQRVTAMEESEQGTQDETLGEGSEIERE